MSYLTEERVEGVLELHGDALQSLVGALASQEPQGNGLVVAKDASGGKLEQRQRWTDCQFVALTAAIYTHTTVKIDHGISSEQRKTAPCPFPHHEQEVVGDLARGAGDSHVDSLLPGLGAALGLLWNRHTEDTGYHQISWNLPTMAYDNLVQSNKFQGMGYHSYGLHTLSML